MKRITKISSMLFLLLMTAWTQMFAATAAEGTATGFGADLFKESLALKFNELTNGKKILIKSANVAGKDTWVTIEKNAQLYNRYLSTTLTKANLFTIVETEQVNSTFTFVLKRETDGKFLKSDGTLTETESEAIKLQAVNPSAGAFGSDDTFYPNWDAPANGSYNYLVRFVQASTPTQIFNVNNANAFGDGTGSWTAYYVLDADALKYIEVNLVNEKNEILEIRSTFFEDSYAVESPIEKTFYTFNKLTLNGVETQAGQTITEDNKTLTYEYIWNLPFESSALNADGTLDMDNAKWYLLKLKTSFIKYTAGENQLSGTDNTDYGTGYWWAFSGDSKNGIKIYNRAAGASQIMTSVSPGSTEAQANNTYPYFAEASEVAANEALNEKWTLYVSNSYAGENGFFLSREGENVKANIQNNKVVYWVASANDGSTFRIVKFADKLTEEETATENYLNGLTTDDIKSLKAEAEKGTTAGIDAALAIRANNRIQYDPNKLYRLRVKAWNLTKDLAAQNGELNALDPDNSNASQIWKIAQTGSEGNYKYQLKSQGIYSVAPTTSSVNVTSTTEEGNAGSFTWVNNENNASVGFNAGGENGFLHFKKADYKSINGYSGTEDASFWYIVLATTIDVDITAAGYATVNYPFAVQVPEEVTAYTGKADAENGVFTLSEIEGGIIPANTPVVLQAAAGTHTLTILADNNDQALESGLEGTLLSKNIESTTNAYILGKKENSEAGFYQMSADDRTLAANKAYLVLPATASAVRSIVFSDGTTTGIESTVAEGTEAEEYYDLQGRRVMNPTKGIYVTKSGKKVLFNK